MQFKICDKWVYKLLIWERFGEEVWKNYAGSAKEKKVGKLYDKW